MTRIDKYLVEKGLCTSRKHAQTCIIAGEVYINNTLAEKSSILVDNTACVEIRSSRSYPYVSRGGVKLEHALRSFNITVKNLCIYDIGASTGGFTDCLLQEGAEKVFSVDVGYGQFDWRLRNDPRVVLLERYNARYLRKEQLPFEPDIVCMDVSFISAIKIIQPLRALLSKPSIWCILIKPQFESERGATGKKGVIRNKELHCAILQKFCRQCYDIQLMCCNLTYSPIKGPKGNIEFWGLFSENKTNNAVPATIEQVVNEAHMMVE